MKLIEMLVVIACIAVVVALFAWAVAKLQNAFSKKPTRRVVVGNINRGFFRRHIRKVYLAPLLIERIAYWLGFVRAPRGGIQFANIGEGTHAHGIKSYIPDAATTARYLMYKIGSDGDHCAVTGAGDIPLGSSDDLADTNALDVPIAIKLFGAVEGTVRIVTDGTLLNGSKVTTGANGQGTVAVSTNLIVGVALIPTDSVPVAGDVVEMIPNLPLKAPF